MEFFSMLRRGIVMSWYATVWFCLCWSVVHAADTPIRNVRVNLFNKNYKVSNVSTVGELQLRIQQKTGLDPLKQGRVMFGTRRLSPMDTLRDVGITDGARIQLLPDNKTLSSERLKRLVEYAAAALGQVEFRMSIDYMWDVLKVLQTIANSSEFQEYMADPTELLEATEEMRQKFNENPDFIRHIQENNLTEDPFFAAFTQGLNDPRAWRRFVLNYVDVFRKFDLNSPAMAKIKQEVGEAFEKGMEMLNDEDFREFIKGEDPEFYDFLQENLDDFSKDDE